MKKKITIIAAVCLVAVILFTPVSMGTLEDGGTRDYRALTYRIIKWNRPNGISEDGTHLEYYQKTGVYFFPYNLKDIDELFELEFKNK